MKHLHKITAAALSVLLLGSLVVPTLAETVSSEKEEVIYIMTDASGNVTDMEAVNIFAGGDITDYGDYSAVKMLNTNDAITQDGEKITFSSDADRVYYQGTMNSTVIPWNISIRYFLDGKEYSPDEISGKSGALEIRFSVSENESCDGSFYEDYALQASFTLDTERCKNIVSNGATVANVGSDKQLTYTILPGKGIDTGITADVADFTMDSVEINGVRLSLTIEVDDTELMEQVDELVSAIGDIDGGASELHDGTGELYDAAGTLSEKIGELDDGVGDLADGTDALYSGLSSITEKSEQLTGAAYTAYEGLCAAAAAALNAQLGAVAEPVSLTPSTYAAVLTQLQEKLESAGAYSQAYQAAAQQVAELMAQLDSYGAFYQGLQDYTGAISDAASGAENLKLNMDTLHSSTGTLKEAAEELNDAVCSLYDGTEELAEGTSEFVDKTANMDTEISDKIDSMTSSVTGSDAETVSFVSDKNTNVASVQFVIKTAAIEEEDTVVSDVVEEETLTFWQKLLQLFGL